jgi:hypothetical protein
MTCTNFGIGFVSSGILFNLGLITCLFLFNFYSDLQPGDIIKANIKGLSLSCHAAWAYSLKVLGKIKL